MFSRFPRYTLAALLAVTLSAPVAAFAKSTESLYEYAYNVFGRLQQNWEQQTYEGRLSNSLLTFVLDDNGQLVSSNMTKANIDTRSGDEVLAFLKKNAPFGHLPEHLRGSQLSFTFKFTPGSLQMVGYQIVDRKQGPALASPINFSPEYAHLNTAGNGSVPPAPKWDNPNTQAIEEEKMAEYVAGVQAQIGDRWQLPEGVNFNKRAVALLTIDTNGKLMGAHLKESSGSKTVDKAALDAVYQAGSFGAVPSEVKALPVQIEYVFDPLNTEP